MSLFLQSPLSLNPLSGGFNLSAYPYSTKLKCVSGMLANKHAIGQKIAGSGAASITAPCSMAGLVLRILSGCESRHQFICCRAKSDKHEGDSLMNLVVDSRQLESQREEAMAILSSFLQSFGLSSEVAAETVKKSNLFIMHLVSMLSLCYRTHYLTGRDVTTIDIRNALLPYLDGLAAEHKDGLKDIILHFPNTTPRQQTVDDYAKMSRSLSKRNSILATLAECESDGDLHPSLLYLLGCGLDLEQVKKLVGKFPTIVSYSMEGKVKTTIEFLSQLGVHQSDIRNIIWRRPQLFGCNLEENLKPTVAYLESLGVEKQCWAKVIMKFPALITYSKRKIKLAVNFILESGIPPSAVGKILTKFPHIVSYSVEDNLIPTAAYFKSMGVDPGLLVFRCPHTFGLSVDDNIMPITKFFLDVGFSMDEISKMVTRFANLYTYSLEGNLRQKWDFYNKMGRSKLELVQFPQYFGYSLEGRIKPRQKVLEQSGIPMRLNRMLSTTDHEFERIVGKKFAEKELDKVEINKLSIT